MRKKGRGQQINPKRNVEQFRSNGPTNEPHPNIHTKQTTAKRLMQKG